MGLFEGVAIEGVLSATIRMATPLLLTSLGGLLAAKAGLRSLHNEGMMLVGAFAGFLGVVLTGNLMMGVLFAMLGGMLMALPFAFLAITAKANQTITGVGINILALGLTSYLMSVYFGGGLTYGVETFSKISIPGLSSIPFIGPILFEHTALTYFAFLLVPVMSYFLYHTPIGLTVRGTGEHPKCVDTLGGNVIRTRYISTLVGGMLAGLGGASLTIGSSGQFVEEITAGKGYIALATLMFGKFSPSGSLLTCLLFGFSEGLQLRMQSAGSAIPFQFLQMLPYILTIIALLTFVRDPNRPAAYGEPYNRQG